jgi:hypothetical protein
VLQSCYRCVTVVLQSWNNRVTGVSRVTHVCHECRQQAATRQISSLSNATIKHTRWQYTHKTNLHTRSPPAHTLHRYTHNTPPTHTSVLEEEEGWGAGLSAAILKGTVVALGVANGGRTVVALGVAKVKADGGGEAKAADLKGRHH